MVPILVFLTLAAFMVADALLVRRFAAKKAEKIVRVQAEKGIEPITAPEIEVPQEKLYHEGHTWVELQRATVAVGLDQFTKNFIGEIDSIDLPSPGAKIKKGLKLWTIMFGDRSLSQPSPISGRILEVNKKLLKNPSLLHQKEGGEDWIMKILPDSLNNESHELYSENQFAKWNDLQRVRFFKRAFPELGMVYNDGGELVPGAARQIDKETWEQLAKQMFYSKEK